MSSNNNNTTNPRPQQHPDPLVLQRLSSTGHRVSNTNDTTNPILLEAKLLELITSIRQLISSNQQLEHAIQENVDDDDDLLQALIENEELIIRKRDNATMLATTLKSRHGVNISLDDKIPLYNGSLLLKKMKDEEEKKKSKNGNDDGGGGLYL